MHAEGGLHREGHQPFQEAVFLFLQKAEPQQKACQCQVLQYQVIHTLPDDLEVYTILSSEHLVNLIKGIFSFQGADIGWDVLSKLSYVSGMVVIKHSSHNPGDKKLS